MNGWTRKFAWFPFVLKMDGNSKNDVLVFWRFYWARPNEGGGDTISLEEFP